MKNILFYILLFAFIYFIYTRLFLKSTLEQENFDPSLVPVSSIVTLAKVAQKLVNGNGTLTNPGNLQIGASTSAAGNLTVTGNERINGNSLIDGTLGVTGATTLSGATNVNNTLGVTSNTTVGGTLGVTGNTTLGGTLGVTGNVNAGNLNFNTRIGQIWSQPGIYAEGSKDLEVGAGSMNVYIGAKNGGAVNNLNVTGSTTVGGNLGVTGEVTGATVSSKNPANSSTYKFIPGGSQWLGGVSANALNLYAYGRTGPQHIADFNDDGSTILFGNTTVGKDLTVNGTTTIGKDLTVNGITNTGTGKWNTSTDGARRVYYDVGNSTNPSGSITQPGPGATYYGSGNGEFAWRKNTDGTMDASKSNTMFLSNTGNLSVTGTANIGLGPLRTLGDGDTMKPAIQLGPNLYLGQYGPNPTWDVIHSNSTDGLLLGNGKPGAKVRVWSDNLTVDGDLCLGTTCINATQLSSLINFTKPGGVYLKRGDNSTCTNGYSGDQTCSGSYNTWYV